MSVATLCPPVSGLTETALVESVELNWTPVSVSWTSYQPRYIVYQSTSPISSVEGMQPVLTNITNPTATVTGLTGGVTYHFAVTAYSTVAGSSPLSSENPAVTSVSSQPTSNITPPVINGVELGGTLLPVRQDPAVPSDRIEIDESGVIYVSVTDDNPISRVEFSMENGILSQVDATGVSDGNGGFEYSVNWNLEAEVDGHATLIIKAYDITDNETISYHDVDIQLAAPDAPAILAPAQGTQLGDLQTNLVVQSVAGVTIDFQVNTDDVDGVLQTNFPVDQNGQMQQLINLFEGNNHILARAVNNRGTAGEFTTVSVTVDQGIPGAPSGLGAQSRPEGVIRLTWNPDTEGTAVGYNIYRSTTPDNFGKINNSLIDATSFEDMPMPEGEYFYRVAGVNIVNEAEIEGPMSGVASAFADATPPTVVGIEYDIIQPFGTGQVGVTLTLSEPLSEPPFLSFIPAQAGTAPIIVDFLPSSTATFNGTVELGGQSFQSTATPVMSAYDRAGNLGTDTGPITDINIDTKGPDVVTLDVTPVAPIDYTGDPLPPLTVTFTLSETPDPNTSPQIWYQLSGEGREEVLLQGLTENAGTYSAVLNQSPNDSFPTNAGAVPETLSFRIHAVDSAGNSNSGIAINNQFQIYQNNLPPLDAPQGLTATSLAGGSVQLSWFQVLEAAEYRLYRWPIDDQNNVTELTVPGNSTDYLDAGFVVGEDDGEYGYAVSSVRRVGQAEAISGPSQSVIATVDSLSPNVPQNLTLALTGSGIQAQWMPSVVNGPGDAVSHYRLYRNDNAAGVDITDIAQATLILDDINPGNLVDGWVTTIDGQPSETERSYVVTAVDGVGNQSLVSNTVYLQEQLLPVHGLQIQVDELLVPALTWAHVSPGSTTYDVYQVDNGNLAKLNSSELTNPSFDDVNYLGSGRVYAVVAKNGQSESLPHQLRLPDLSAGLMVEQSLKRGLMNELFMEVSNHEAQAIDHVSISLVVNNKTYQSNETSIAGFGSAEVSLVIPGDLPAEVDEIDAQMTVHYQPNPGVAANIHGQINIPVDDGGLIISITTNNFVRGTTGEIQLLIQNPGEQSVDLITAMGTGSQDSDDVELRLEDDDGNTLALAGFRQVLGNNVFTFPGGVTVARIPAGESYLSSPQPIDIPANAGDHVVVIASINQMYYDYGSGDPVSLQGVVSRHPAVLANTSYVGQLDNISDLLIVQDQFTDIAGKAVTRDSGDPVANVPLNLSLRNEGFEQNIPVFTDVNGEFVHRYEPTSTEAGVFQVSVTHPDILDRPMDGSFQVGKIFAAFQDDDVRIPFSVNTEHQLYVKAPRGLSYQNVRAELVSVDHPNATVSSTESIAQLDHQMGWQPLTVNLSVAGNFPLEDQTLIMRIVADDTGGLQLGRAMLIFDVEVDDPVLTANPQLIYTALNYCQAGVDCVTTTESFELSNQGFSNALDVSLEIIEVNSQGVEIPGAIIPDWLTLATNSEVGEIGIYESTEVSVNIEQPDSSYNNRLLNYRVRISSANAATLEVPLVILVTQSGEGSVVFQTGNYLTNPEADTGWLEGVKISLINDIDPFAVPILGDSLNKGRTVFYGVPAGWYRYHATKANHEELTGRIQILPGNSNNEGSPIEEFDPVEDGIWSQYEYLFMNRNFVTIDWSVTEISIEDRYEVVMNVTFETNVDAPVVLISPTVTNLPDMYPGDVYTGMLEIKNVGLLRAHDFALNVPPEDEFFRYEILGEIPEVLEAGESHYLPFRLINKKTLVPGADGGAGGGGCHGYTNQINGAYKFQCPSGEIDGNATPSYVNYTAGSDCASGQGQRNRPPRNSNDGGPLDFRCWQEDAALWCGGPGATEESVQCAPDCDGDQCCPTMSGGSGPPPSGPPPPPTNSPPPFIF